MGIGKSRQNAEFAADFVPNLPPGTPPAVLLRLLLRLLLRPSSWHVPCRPEIKPAGMTTAPANPISSEEIQSLACALAQLIRRRKRKVARLDQVETRQPGPGGLFTFTQPPERKVTHAANTGKHRSTLSAMTHKWLMT